MFRILKKDADTRARTGLLETPHGVVETPAFVVVGTHAKVRALTAGDLQKTGTQIIIANTYHLWQKLGEEGLKVFPGLHAAMQWDGPLMTDSGGFQVFSMGIAREHGIGKVAPKIIKKPVSEHSHPDIVGMRMLQIDSNGGQGIVKITEDGVVFTESGIRYWLDAEKSIRIQQQLGADIMFAFDEPTSPRHDSGYTSASLVRTHAWARRSLAARTSRQLLYGIVQGGSFEDLRRESARVIPSLPFDGFAIGGSYANSYGSTREQSIREVGWVTPLLPEDKPRHLLGIGLIPDIFAGVSAGIDTFDCVVPTREARHGSLWTGKGERIDITKGKYRDDKTMLDEQCACVVCAEMKTEKGALHAMFKEKNPEARRLATIHNVSFFNLLMSRIRASILNGSFSEEKRRALSESA
ncbi:MAG: queuine tRNA-ribosyltransferase [Parcubacteria group bacterium Greene0714_36]|nr:MAG: queuine tRNA-ribosyltransferase [Parcubacteria group bacterium Greene0714_36]